MRDGEPRDFWSHYHVRRKVLGGIDFRTRQRVPDHVEVEARGDVATVPKIRADPGFPISRFTDLVAHCGELHYRNPRWFLLYRGQSADFQNSNGKTDVYPSIYRAEPGQTRLTGVRTRRRHERLLDTTRFLAEHSRELGLSGPLSEHDEFWMALLQHYQLSRTPLVDVTTSLLVAASFALLEHGGAAREEGFLLVFAVPNPRRCLSKIAEDRLAMARVQALCPPTARRPHHQDAWLVGQWPSSSRKERNDNLAHRLIGKYRLDNSDGGFFSNGFSPIEMEALLPKEDPFRDSIADLVAQAS